MGLSVSLSNALSGMNTTQKGLEVLSRNVSNDGTPGYHRQSVRLSEETNNGSTYARLASIDRAFNEALQRYYNKEMSGAGEANIRADFMGRVEVFLGKPGDPTSLDTVYQNFEKSMQAVATSPDDYTVRATAVSNAQLLATTLNDLTSSIQGLRQEAESQISNHVSDINLMLQSLDRINGNLTDQTSDPASRSSMLDERDRLVASIAEIIDINVTYRADDTVALMTNSGLGLVDNGATVFEFQSAGALNAGKQYSPISGQDDVGLIYATTSSGLRVDVIRDNGIQSGRIGGLLELRDVTLVEMQGQLDDIASSLAQALSTIETAGTEVASPPADGFSIDTADMQSGNDFTVSYTLNGVKETVRVVRVDDPASLPMDTTGPNGERVIGLDFSGGIGAVATALDAALGAAITVTNPAGTTLQIVDDGAGNTSDIDSLLMRTTVSGDQGGGLALSLFTDSSNADFTNSLDGDTQKLGYAGRIRVNSNVVGDNTLLVQYAAGNTLGDADRANYLLENLQDMTFTSENSTTPKSGNFRLTGNAQTMISQMLNYQGTVITAANGVEYAQNMALESVTQRMDAEYGVDIDEEMARLMELQNAYAAAARVVSIVQELIDALMRI